MIKRFINLFCNMGLLLMTAQLHAQIVQGDRNSLAATLAEDILIAGDYTQVGLYARRNEAPSDIKVAYFELFNSSGEAVVQEMGYLEKGIGKMILRVPSNVASGYYLFRAYTSDSDLAEKSSIAYSWIAVINPLDPPALIPAMNLAERKEGLSQKIRLDKTIYGSKEPININIDNAGKLAFLSVKKDMPEIIPREAVLDQMSNRSTVFRDIREISGHIVKISNVDRGEQVFLSSFGREKEMYFAEPEEDGVAYIFMDSKRRYDNLILQSSGGAAASLMKIASPFWQVKPTVKNWPVLEVSKDLEEVIMKKMLQSEVKKFYNLPDTLFGPKPAPLIDAYHVYELDDYQRFETLGLTLKEYVGEVVLRNRRGKTEFRVRNVGGVTKENPLVLLDGVPIFDIDALSKWDPKDIKRIEVSNRYYKLGSKEVQGIINMYSFHGDMAKFPLGDQALVLDYPRPQPLLKINFPEYTGVKADRRPDFRSLLYWTILEPTNAEVKFYTADHTGTFLAQLKYLDEDGQWREESVSFEVKEQ